jgi:type IV pilus assembly protein PilV
MINTGDFMIHDKQTPLSETIKKENGFTLIEVLIALTIFSIGILAVGTMQFSSMNGTATANHSTQGATWAVDRLEKLMSLPYNHNDLDNAVHQATSPDGIYTITWTVTESEVIPKTKSVRATVAWQHGLNGAGQVTINHIIPQVL